MIIDPDFLDHWKTRMLCEILDDESAPLYLVRIWAHCQNRRNDIFQLSAIALKAICRAKSHSPEELQSALVEAGFLKILDSGEFLVIGWRERNKSLFSRSENGKLGGRGNKKNVVQEEFSEKLEESYLEADRKLNESYDKAEKSYDKAKCEKSKATKSDKSREEKSREEMTLLRESDAPRLAFATLEEISRFAAAQMPPIAENVAEIFHAESEARGWADRSGLPIRDWRHALRAYALKWRENDRQRAANRQGIGVNGEIPRHKGTQPVTINMNNFNDL